MIQFQGAIWMAPEPADMRKGIDGLSLQVRASLGHNPCAGDAFLFRNRAGNRIKILLWDGTGVWLCQRRLHRGTSAGRTRLTRTSPLRAKSGIG